MTGGIITNLWNKYFSAFKDFEKDVYFTEEYLKLHETEKDGADCFIYEEGNNIFLFPFLKREHYLFGEHFFDFETPNGYGGPIANTKETNFIKTAQYNFISYCKENNFIAGFVRFHPLLDNDVYFENIGEIIQDRMIIAIDLALSEKEIWEKEIHSKHRNVIRKAENNGLQFVIDNDYRYMDDFVRLYENTMNKVDANKNYYFNQDYYWRLAKTIKNSFLGLVRYDNKTIAAAIFLYSKNFGHYHLSGSDINYLHLSPNNYLLYSTALYLKGLEVEKFNLGGGSSRDIENSLLKFKERFSKNKYWFKIGKVIFDAQKYKNICDSWEKINPEKRQMYKNINLKYRY